MLQLLVFAAVPCSRADSVYLSTLQVTTSPQNE